MRLKTLRIVAPATPENPLGHVLINESDFDAAKGHVLFADEAPIPATAAAADADPAPKAVPTRELLDAALASLPGKHSDPDFVVLKLTERFGDLFTEADEAKARAAFVKKRLK